jgi:hypothetical protein
VAACSGKCGREGAGPIDSGDPGLDKQFTWCDSCWSDLYNKRMPPGLIKDLPPGAYVPFNVLPPPPSPNPLYNSLAATEHKIMAGAEVKSVATVAAAPVTGSGTFSGYLASYGRDHGGDTIMPGAMDESAAALNSGAIAWHLTDAHSDRASDVVASVTAAAVDARGLRIEGVWAPTQAAQSLRQMVRNGQRIGLSIDYYADASRPDGKGGRYLDKITIVGGAVTPKPMNPMAVITEGKGAAMVAPVVDVYADVQARHRADPEREAEDRLLAAASWPPPGMFDRKTALSLIRGAAVAASRRELDGDPEQARVQARWERDNEYSSNLHAWMAAHQ